MLEEPSRFVYTNGFAKIQVFERTFALDEAIFHELMVLLPCLHVVAFGRKTVFERTRHAGSFK